MGIVINLDVNTARSELRNTLSASGVEHAVFWDDAAGIFR